MFKVCKSLTIFLSIYLFEQFTIHHLLLELAIHVNSLRMYKCTFKSNLGSTFANNFVSSNDIQKQPQIQQVQTESIMTLLVDYHQLLLALCHIYQTRLPLLMSQQRTNQCSRLPLPSISRTSMRMLQLLCVIMRKMMIS